MSYVHTSEKPDRTLLRLLRTVGTSFGVATELDSVLRRLPRQLVIVDLDGLASSDVERLCDAVRTDGCRLLVVCRALGNPRLTELLSRNVLPHVIVGELEHQERALRVTLQKILRQDVFGLEKYFGWGVETHHFALKRTPDAEAPLKAAAELADYLGLGPRLVMMFKTAVQEMITNAFFNAPTNADGTPRHHLVARDKAIELHERELIKVTLACDDSRLGASVVDAFGSLTFDTLFRAISRAELTPAREVQTISGGAGLGLRTVYESFDATVLNIAPGHRTESIGLLELGGHYRDFLQRPKSLTVFRQLVGEQPLER